MINTIGPVWDGNEVWLLVAGGATFAAFPNWYATLFSGFYLPLLLILLALIVRGVAFEYRAKGHGEQWKNRWDAAIVIGSFIPSLLWGVAFANILRGTPIDKDMEYTGGFFNLLNPYALVGGLTTLLLFLTHGAIYTALKTDGPIRERARALAVKIGLAAAVVAVVFLVWTQLLTGNVGSAVFFVLAAACLVGALVAVLQVREGWAFIGTFACLALAVAGLFIALFPDVMVSSTSALFNLTTSNASSTHYTLTVMTIVAVIFTPARAGLPGLDLLGLPQAHRGAAHPCRSVPAAARGARRRMRPTDPRLVRRLAPAKRPLAGVISGGVGTSLLVIGQAWLVAGLVVAVVARDGRRRAVGPGRGRGLRTPRSGRPALGGLRGSGGRHRRHRRTTPPAARGPLAGPAGCGRPPGRRRCCSPGVSPRPSPT